MSRTIKGLIYYENAEIPMRRGILSSGRPVVVVCERPSGTAVQVVPITSGNKAADGRPTHVPISSLRDHSVAVCEQIRTVDFTELSRYPRGFCTEDEIDRISAVIGEMFGTGIQE